MRHPRPTVHAIRSIKSPPNLYTKRMDVNFICVFFLVLGSKTMVEAREMRGGSKKTQEEMKEAGEKFECSGGMIPLERLEEGESDMALPLKNSRVRSNSVRNFCNLILGSVFVQAFVLLLGSGEIEARLLQLL